jgi:hypothetical protein
MKAQRGSRCIALLFLQPRRLMEVGGQRHAPAALPPGKTRYPLYRRLGGPQGRSGRMRKISPPPPGFDTRTVQPIASRYTGPYASCMYSGLFILGLRCYVTCINPLNAELNPIRYLLALARAHHFVDVSRIRVKWQCECIASVMKRP